MAAAAARMTAHAGGAAADGAVACGCSVVTAIGQDRVLYGLRFTVYDHLGDPNSDLLGIRFTTAFCDLLDKGITFDR